MKSKRQEEILRIIESKSVGTQEILQKELESKGFYVTQATLSRDIKELNLVKQADSSGKYRYCQQIQDKTETDSRIFMNNDSIISADYALNTVVIKCHTGYAQGVCAKFDKEGIENSLGTIAGDDTIFILMRTEKAAENFVRQIKSKFHL